MRKLIAVLESVTRWLALAVVVWAGSVFFALLVRVLWAATVLVFSAAG